MSGSSSSKMDTTPDEDELWSEIGGHFESFTQVVSEFIDNSKSNFDANSIPSRSVHIQVNEVSNKTLHVQVEDQGTGITDLESALRLGDKSITQSPLNEHGFGMKHALASGNPSNDSWAVYTRTESEVKNGEYRKVSDPYRFDISFEQNQTSAEPWPGVYNGSGTLIEFECSRSFFDSVHAGVPGVVKNLDTALDYLREDLGYIYSKIIEDGGISITINSDFPYSETVQSVRPDYAGFYDPPPGEEVKDLGAGDVTIEYRFGEMEEMNYRKYYKRSISTSGVEIRLNGRVLEDGLFSEIWDLEEHPKYNHFLGIVDIKSEESDRLPDTKTAKNGIRSGDQKLQRVFQWLRNTIPKPPIETTDRITENGLLDELKSYKENHIPSQSKRVEREFDLFTNVDSAVPADLYVFDGTNTQLYEGKKNTAGVSAVYQLLMYWDGAVKDGLDPDEAILVASDFSQGTEEMIKELNRRTDANDNKYTFRTTTWQDQDIDHP